MINEFSYIGDGVYAKYDGYGILIHVNDHKNPTDKVYLEPGVLQSLNDFFNRELSPTKESEKGKYEIQTNRRKD
jgi:hypothetical protein